MSVQSGKINVSGNILEFSSTGRGGKPGMFRRLRLGERIGGGSSSDVFVGTILDGSSARPRDKVAVKVLRPSMMGTSAHERFMRESELLCRLSHPNLVRGMGMGLLPADTSEAIAAEEAKRPVSGGIPGDTFVGRNARPASGFGSSSVETSARRSRTESSSDIRTGDGTGSAGSASGTGSVISGASNITSVYPGNLRASIPEIQTYGNVQLGDENPSGMARLPFLVMELVEGPSLAEYMLECKRRDGKPNIENAIRIVMGIAGALGYLHLDGRVLAHRDVKPGNVMIAPGCVPKLMDLGVAKTQMVASTPLDTRMAGTTHFMAPEQIADSSRADVRSDIYSLGIVLFEMAGGHLPYDERVLLAMRLTGDVPQLQTRDGSMLTAAQTGRLNAIIAKMCAYEPHKRYQTPQNLVVDLGKFLQDSSEGKLADRGRKMGSDHGKDRDGDAEAALATVSRSEIAAQPSGEKPRPHRMRGVLVPVAAALGVVVLGCMFNIFPWGTQVEEVPPTGTEIILQKTVPLQ